MTLDEMKDLLTQIQNESSQTKILNAILTCYAEIKGLERGLVKTQQAINQIIKVLNNSKAKENIAETVNPEEDAPVNESVPQVPEEDK